MKDTSTFSACHMNHSGRQPNVVHSCQRSKKLVQFFTRRKIQVGMNAVQEAA